MPVCGRLERASFAAVGSGRRFLVASPRNARPAVDFGPVVQRLLPDWEIATLPNGCIQGEARCGANSANSLHAQAETVLYLLETSVTINDSADASHALRIHDAKDEETSGWVRSDIGKLVRRAKSYDRERNCGDQQAAKRLADEMLQWITVMPLYCDADLIVPAPSTNPDKAYDLPAMIAGHLSSLTSKEIATIRSSNAVPQKGLAEKEKASAESLARHYDVIGDAAGKSVLVIDDIYESGATVGAMTLALRSAGAREVLSLTATKAAKGCHGLTASTDNWPMEA